MTPRRSRLYEIADAANGTRQTNARNILPVVSLSPRLPACIRLCHTPRVRGHIGDSSRGVSSGFLQEPLQCARVGQSIKAA